MESVLDEEKIGKIIEKTKMYKNEEDILFADLEQKFVSLRYPYQTDNKKLIDNFNKLMGDKLKVIQKIHNNNIFVLTKTLEKYINAKIEVETKFNNMDI